MGAASDFGTAIDGSARWLLRLFGDFQLTGRRSGEKVAVPGKRERVLLAYLALSPNGRRPRRKLVTLLWGEAADEASLENLRTSVFNLRKVLGDTERRIVASEDRDILFDASAFEVDILEFRRLTASSGVAELEQAAKLYGGDFLEGLSIESEEFESWHREESTRCKGQALDALTKLMTQLGALGENERAIETGLRILRYESMHEEAVRRLMRLYAENGRRAVALELYRTLADSLKKELGAQPEAETLAVYAEITQSNKAWTATPADAKSPHPAPTTTRANVMESVLSPAEHSVLAADSFTPIASPKVRRRSIAWLAAGSLAAAAVAVLLFVASSEPTSKIGPTTVVAATPTSAIAVAVLPFANLSSERDQDFFSDGLTDEISSALAKVPALRIVARTSAFEFKGQNRNIRTIGEQLGATHLIEGSVRRAGDRVRITVQLIRADDGTRIWSEDFDRQLTDIFAIQEEIARAIASLLRVPLGLEPGANLVNNRSIDPESYEKYLRAKAVHDQRALFPNSTRAASMVQAASVLEEVVGKNPDYAPAWLELAGTYTVIAQTTTNDISQPVAGSRVRANQFREKAEGAVRKAIQLDPNFAAAYIGMAVLTWSRGKPLEALPFFEKAQTLDPTADFLAYGIRLGAAGRLNEALAVLERGLTIDPFNLNLVQATAHDRWLNGQNEAAIALAKTLQTAERASMLAQIYASLGRFTEAADELMATSRDPNSAEARAARLLRTAPAKAAAAEELPNLPSTLDFVYLYVGAPDRAIETYERRADVGFFFGNQMAYVWHPVYAPVRKTERFKALMRKAGLVDYWRARGWPEFCRPVGADDFACD